MAQQGAAGKPEEVAAPVGDGDTSEGEGEGGGDTQAEVPVRNRPRRKATEKPTGPDALRQSFSKRKKGIAAKAYQLNRLTDAKVALFVVNDKGSSWAYATPGFGAAVSPAYLAMMRKLAELPQTPKLTTEVISHPADEHSSDDREQWEMHLHPALAELSQPGAGPLYKIQHGQNLGANMVAMLHSPFPSAGQAVGHPAGISILHQAHPSIDEVTSAAAAMVQPMYSGSYQSGHQPSLSLEAPQSAEDEPAEVEDDQTAGMKRAAAHDPEAEASKQLKTENVLGKPLVMLTRQAAILPVEAPPPEGVFSKMQNPFAPTQKAS